MPALRIRIEISKNKLFNLIALLFLIVFFTIPDFLYSQSRNDNNTISWDSDWSDLQRDPGALYGSEKDEKYSVNALIVEIEDWDDHYSLSTFFLYRYTNYPKFTSHRFFPFFENLSAKNDARFKNYTFPLYYYKTDGIESNFITAISWSQRNSRKDETLDLLGLFYRHHEAGKKFYSIFPLLFLGFDEVEDSGNFTIFPVFHYDFDSCKNEKQCESQDTLISPLMYYSSKSDSDTTFLSWLGYYDFSAKKDETTLFFPILPVFYRYTQAQRQTKQLIANVYYSRDNQDSSGVFHIWPLLFLDWSQKNNGNMLFPVYSYKSSENSSSLYSILFGWEKSSQSGDRVSSMNYSLLHYYQKSSDQAAFHLFPLYFSSENKWETDTLLLPLFYLNSQNGEDKTKNSYYHLLGYSIFKQDASRDLSSSEWLLLPFWYSSNDDTKKTSSLSYVNPLFAWKKSVQQIDGEYYHKSSFWFPIVPVYYSSNSNASSTTLIVPTWWQIDNKKDELVKLGFFPIYMADYYPDGYQHILPLLYFSFYDTTDQENEKYLAIAPMHYHNRRSDRLTFWLGLYYSYSDESDQDYVDHLFPLYYSWWDKQSKGNILLPLYLNYEDDNKYYHLNIGGLSLGQEKIPGANVYEKDGVWHIDSEIGFFYNLFRLETRVTLFADEMKRIEKEEKSIFPEPVFDRKKDINLPSFRKENKGIINGPYVTRDLVKNRKNSNTFWGMSTLFGLVSYEKADTHRHFRILPLSWLSWDESDDDQVSFIFAAYASYTGKNSSYLAVFPGFFPVYGYQEDKDSRVDAFAAILYIKETEVSKDYTEHSILWPFINFYSSPAKSGFRLFPIVWHKQDYETSQESGQMPRRRELKQSSTWALLFYDRQDSRSGWQTLIPLYYTQNSTRDLGNGMRQISSSLFGLPLIYYNSTTHKDKPGNDVVHAADSYSLFVPGYYRKRSALIEKDSFLFGLLSFKSQYQTNVKQIPDQKPVSSDVSFLFGLADYSSNLNGDSNSWLFPLYYYDNDSTGLSAGFPILPILFYYEGNASSSTTWIFPTWWEDKPGYKSRLIANIWYSNDEKKEKTAFHILPIYLSWLGSDEKSFFVSGLYFDYNEYGNHQNLFGVLYDRDRTYKTNRTEHCLLLCMISVDSSNRYWQFEMLWGGLMDLESRERSWEFGMLWGGLLGIDSYSDQSYEFNLLWLGVDHQYDKKFENNLLPIWYVDRKIELKKYEYYIPVLLSWGNSGQNYGSHYWGLGLLYYDDYNLSAREHSEHWLAGILWQDIRKPQRGYRTRGMLWRYLWEYQIEEDTDYTKFSVLKFLFSRKHKDGETSYRVFGIRLN